MKKNQDAQIRITGKKEKEQLKVNYTRLGNLIIELPKRRVD